ncbi:type IV pilin protein [Acinetobacter sp. Ver3]|uniref:type IV pilin protein n=1 Tax=Acinetobacter sp. Ver3 TaxID=466088 RepID=UPI00054F7B8C|nr:prepilin-type N-terminal cleavage/methylation domain-containing protein [Acinetobacter sp. Ver3]
MNQKGFTLIELMVVVVIIAILMTIAVPSYQSYLKRNAAAQAQQEISKIIEQLERYKSRSFSYRGFDAKYIYDQDTSMTSISLPDAKKPKYVISIADISEKTPKTLLSSDQGLGRAWGIRAVPTQTGYDAFLATSQGIRCKTEYLVENDLKEVNAYTGCGANAKQW